LPIQFQKQKPNWVNKPLVVVAAPGPSLRHALPWVKANQHVPVIAVQNAVDLLPWADVLYACDNRWWKEFDGYRHFRGAKWSSHTNKAVNDKEECQLLYGLNIVHGKDQNGFCLDGQSIHYLCNSGMQAVNLALLFGATCVALVGFDWRQVDGRSHFFGEYTNLGNPVFGKQWTRHAEIAAKTLPETIKIYNCTPGSALTCFPMADLDDYPNFNRE
jgi:hypothetical protein